MGMDEDHDNFDPYNLINVDAVEPFRCTLRNLTPENKALEREKALRFKRCLENKPLAFEVNEKKPRNN